MKQCKVCGREVENLWSKGRCFYCSKISYARKSRKKTSRRKSSKKSPKLILDEVFSNYIKLRNQDEHGHLFCFTSLKRLPRVKIDAGHYIPRGHLKYRWDERNVFPQSIFDNRFKSGAPTVYKRHLTELYGEDFVTDREGDKYSSHSMSKYDMEQLIEHYEQLTLELKPDPHIGEFTEQGQILWVEQDGGYICRTQNGLIII